MLNIETDKFILRKFSMQDMYDLHILLSDKSVNTFLPWFTHNSIKETGEFYENRIRGQQYCFAICQKENNSPI
ncbi:GNAT family N-acetyltransferase [Candidatus Enterococcus ferrettii]|uniref:N-acetyltransferase domain-containing protein n=1 Tax=Candidatus Enterococcus ferrettii TaxID=2815324 RepID=A0ABV0EVQ9_9ENTE|nr:hypothetical protein [Enterococcus sp. 665A]